MPDQAIPELMRALRLHEQGGAEAMRFDLDVPVPQPGIGDVLIRVAAASLTPTELGWPSTWVDHAGKPRTPVVPCHEVCGEVVALGYGTMGFARGDVVFGITDWYRDGAAAEYVAVEARNLALKPNGLTAGEAAALALPGLTAHQALFRLAGLSAGQTVLISGATGGVGAIAVQLARGVGAVVIAAGRKQHAALARGLGVDGFVDVDDPGGLDGIDTIDVAFDLVGGEFRDRVVARGVGAVVSVVEPHAGLEFFVVEGERSTFEELSRLVDAGTIRPVVSETIALADGAGAFADKPHGQGKRVIEVLAS